MRGFRNQDGWSGCLALPREVKLGDHQELIQQPARETDLLRVRHLRPSIQTITGRHDVAELRGRELEIHCRFKLHDAVSFGLRVLGSPDGSHGLDIRHDHDGLYVGSTLLMAMRRGEGEEIDLRVFVDRSVVEVFIQGGRHSVTRVHRGQPADNRVELFAHDGKVELILLEGWSLRNEGIFTMESM